jgi:GTPase Era involved in 16S rRNA processing
MDGILNELMKIYYLRVGVIGNGNKGKSFILQKFSGNELAKILYPKNGKMNNIIFMDTAGFETPLLNSLYQEKLK